MDTGFSNTVMHWNVGKMEYWNNGIKGKEDD
jgi:hypothetical protein